MRGWGFVVGGLGPGKQRTDVHMEHGFSNQNKFAMTLHAHAMDKFYFKIMPAG